MFSVCILFVRENGFVYVTLKWFIGNIEREIKERFVTLKKKVEASIGRKRERKSGPHLSTAMWAPPLGSLVGPTMNSMSIVAPPVNSLCGAQLEQYTGPLRTVCRPTLNSIVDPWYSTP